LACFESSPPIWWLLCGSFPELPRHTSITESRGGTCCTQYQLKIGKSRSSPTTSTRHERISSRAVFTHCITQAAKKGVSHLCIRSEGSLLDFGTRELSYALAASRISRAAHRTKAVINHMHSVLSMAFINITPFRLPFALPWQRDTNSLLIRKGLGRDAVCAPNQVQ
jgi:hypothetical protein